jgi:AsmA family protein
MSATAPLRRHPVLFGLLAFFVLLVIAVGVCEWRGWPFLRGPMERTLASKLDRDVRVGQGFSLHLLRSVRLGTDTLHIGPPRWAPDERGGKFFDAQNAALELPWSTVWNFAVAKKPVPLRVRSLDVGAFEAVLWRRADGRANWQFELPQADPNKPRTQPEFERLVVRNGRLTLDDATHELSMQAEATTSEGLGAGPEAGLDIRGGGRYREGNFNFTMHSDGVLPLVAGQGDRMPVRVAMSARTPNGRVKFDGEARDVVHLSALSGKFAVSGNSLDKVAAPFGVTLPTTAAFEAEGRIGKQGEIWRARFERFDVGSSRLAGDFEFDRRPARPLLTGTLSGRNLDLADLGPAFGAPAPGSGNPPKPSGKLFPQKAFNIPSLQQMNADVRVDLQRADLHTPRLEPFTPLKGRVALKDGVLTLSDLDAYTSGGQVRGQVTLDGRQVKDPKWTGDLRVAGVSLEQWLNVQNRFEKPGSTGPRHEGKAPTYVTGRLGGHLKFDGRGNSVAEMMSTLNGTITAWVNDGTISHLALEAAGLDIAQAIGVLIKGDAGLKMQCAATQFTARDGDLQMDVGIIDTSDTTLLVQGQVNLDEERLDLKARAYPKDFSFAALRSPLHVEGPLTKPKVKLEGKAIAAKAGAAAVMGAVVAPLAALVPLFDPARKAPLGCEQALAELRGTRGKNVEPPKVQAAGTERAQPAERQARRQGQAPAQVGEQPAVPNR